MGMVATNGIEAIAQTAAVKQSLAKADAEDAKEDAARKEALDAIAPLANRIRTAPASRATVELATRSLINDQELSIEKAVYQISTGAPKLYACFFKSPGQSFRVYCDGKSVGVQIDEDGYFMTAPPESLQAAVTNLPAPLGPYPEPVMALTFCGVDVNDSLFTDMQSIAVIDREPYNNVPAAHLRGVQLDGVTWDLWIATAKDKEQPLRMVVDLTKVISTGDGDALPDGFRYEVEMLFTLWRMNGDYQEKQFTYAPPKDAVQYESLEDYYASASTELPQHELVGKASPAFEAVLLPQHVDLKGGTESKEEKTVQVKDLKGKVVILDFWATWCGPCIEAMPVVDGVAKKFLDRGVEFYAINIGEAAPDVQKFLSTAKVRPNVLMDPEGEIASAFKAEAIPQTVLIGKDGVVEAVHVGYASLESLEKELTEQLEVLVLGGRLRADEGAGSESDADAGDGATATTQREETTVDPKAGKSVK
jgi:thiol-disulfide isomerase/thioredoxin